MASIPHRAIDDLAHGQGGVVSRPQLSALGVQPASIAWAVRARRWRLVGRAVVVHRGELTRDARWWVAVIHAGPGALLCAWTAAEAQGLQRFERETVHVVVTRGHRMRALPWMKVHVSRRLKPEDLHPALALPQVRVARALIDMATWSSTPRKACAVLAAGVQQRLVTVQQLRDELDRAGKIRYHRLLGPVLHDIEGGSQALSELDLVRVCRTYGLPAPYQQGVRRDSKGRRRYLDAWWRRHDGRIVHAEVDGSAHVDVEHWWDDMDRQTDLAIADDALVVRLAAAALRAEPYEAARRIARALDITLTRAA
jgi:hypothetical protein